MLVQQLRIFDCSPWRNMSDHCCGFTYLGKPLSLKLFAPRCSPLPFQRIRADVGKFLTEKSNNTSSDSGIEPDTSWSAVALTAKRSTRNSSVIMSD